MHNKFHIKWSIMWLLWWGFGNNLHKHVRPSVCRIYPSEQLHEYPGISFIQLLCSPQSFKSAWLHSSKSIRLKNVSEKYFLVFAVKYYNYSKFNHW